MFIPDEVVRFFIYGFLFLLLSNISPAHANEDHTAFAYNDDDIKEPNFSNYELNADYKDLNSIYDDTAELLYNSTGDGAHPDVHQVYPSQNRQNYTGWFDNLLNSVKSANSPMMYNFSSLFPNINTSKDAYYRLPDTFRVFPNDKNLTVLNLKIPSNMTKLDSNIFQDAFDESGSTANGQEIYMNMPPIDSISLNQTDKVNLVNQFFNANAIPSAFPTSGSVSSGLAASAPSMPTTSTGMPPTAVLQRPAAPPMDPTIAMNPTSNTPSFSSQSSSNSIATDLLAKRMAEDETKNATFYIRSMLDKLGLSRISMDGNPKEPMYVYKMNTTSDAGTGNFSQPQNYTVPMKNFYFGRGNTDERPPSAFLPLGQNQTMVPPVPNGSQNQSIPYISTKPLAGNGSGYQSNLTYYGVSVNSGVNNPDSEILNISFSSMVNDSVSNLYGGIVYTSVYFIPGSSTPPQPYPNDPYANVTYWPEGINELTNDGKKELFKLGRWLREQYQLLTGPQYNRSLVSIDSGASDIALTSAESVAAGLFLPHEKEIWNPLMMWQPTPVRSTPITDDNMILMSKYCKQYDLQTANLNKSPEWIQFFENNTETMNYISQNTGSNFTKTDLLNALRNIFYYYEDLRIEEENNLPLPNWTNSVYPERMRYFAQQYIDYAVSTRALQKIKTGPFFKTIIDNMSAKINSTESDASSEFSETMHLYSGDVVGIAFIMKTLGIFNSIPPNASALIFDLRYKENDFTVTVSFKNSSSDTLYVLTVPQCNPVCKFSQFISITNDLMLDDWDNYCETVSIFDMTYTIPIIVFGLAVIFILTLVIILLIVKCCKNIRKKRASFG